MEYPTTGTYEYNTVNTTGMTISGTVSTQVFSSNPRRIYARIRNDGPNLAYIGVGVEASKTKGELLIRGATWETDRNKIYRGTINAIANTAATSQRLSVLDGYISNTVSE